jgi:threonine dehydratase
MLHAYVYSFKERGACYALVMLSEEQKRKGVISASLGNHALALSYHGNKLNIPVTVVMPIVAPIMKIQACQQHRATVVVKGQDMGEAKRIALQLSKEKNLVYING